MNRNFIKVLGLFVAVVFGIAGCGGGGSGGTGTQTPVTPGGNIAPVTVSGTASEGTLITGKTVKLKDANGTSAVDGTTNATTGIYTVDVTGLIAPFLVTVTGTNGTYVSLAQTAGTANINPITTTVVALAAGNSDVSALFTSITPAQLTTLNTNYVAKSALVTASLQSALPAGVEAQDYFTGTITAGTGMDSVFDTYRITVNPTTGITVKTKDASATTVLTIPTATVTANTSQALPTIIAPTTTGNQNTLINQSNWHAVDLPTSSAYLFGVVYGNSKFVSVGEGYNYIQSSNDGSVWEVKTNNYTLGKLQDITYGAGRFVSVGAYNGIAISTDNGSNWQSYLSILVEHFKSVAFGNGVFVSGGTKDLGQTGVILTSTDGISWTSRYSEAFTTIFKIAYGNGTFVAVGTNSSGGVIYTSNDHGVTWTTRKSNFEHSLGGIAFGNGVFSAVGGGGVILTSKDNGATWQQHTSGITDQINSVTFGNGVFAAVSGNFITKDRILVSNDNGTTWSVISLNTSYTLNDICFGNSSFVAVGNFGTYRSDTL